jgi:hypothetical protein
MAVPTDAAGSVKQLGIDDFADASEGETMEPFWLISVFLPVIVISALEMMLQHGLGIGPF